MTKTYSFLLLLSLMSCQGDPSPPYFPEKDNLRSDVTFVLDTIIEKNTPKALDMSRHQLFIDTSRNYVREVPLGKSTLKAAINNMVTDLNKVAHSISMQIPMAFHSNFVQVHKREEDNNFVLYDRCDGSDPIYSITTDKILQLGVSDLSVYTIGKVIVAKDDELHLILNTINPYIDDKLIAKEVDFHIKHTSNTSIFELVLDNSLMYVTPLEFVNQFDVLVNHCPTQKVTEYNSFSK